MTRISVQGFLAKRRIWSSSLAPECATKIIKKMISGEGAKKGDEESE